MSLTKKRYRLRALWHLGSHRWWSKKHDKWVFDKRQGSRMPLEETRTIARNNGGVGFPEEVGK